MNFGSLVATAAAAVMAASMMVSQPPDGDVAVAILTVQPLELHFADDVDALEVTACNVGQWGCWYRFMSDEPWLICPDDEHLCASECRQVVLRVERGDLPDGDYECRIEARAYWSGAEVWPHCLSGPGVAYPWPECYPLDLDRDGDVDLADFALAIVD